MKYNPARPLGHSYFRITTHMSVLERLASLDRARGFLEQRIPYAHNPHTREEYQTALDSLQQRRTELEAQLNTGTSLIERALCAPKKRQVARYGNWMAQVFHDPAFVVHKAPSDGNCLFHVVSGATGEPVDTLKRRVAQSATHEEFVIKKGLWQSAVDDYPKVKQRLGQTPPSSPYYKGMQAQLANLADDMQTYRWLSNITTLEEYRAALMQHGVWGDADAVGHIENALNLKLLIFSLRQKECPEIYCNTMIPEGFHPNHYILVAYHPLEAHYDLVKHADRALFAFDQLPYSVRRLFSQECPQLTELGGWVE